MTAETRRKAAARCVECDTSYVVWVRPEDGISPIGTGGDCPCGGSEFRVLS